MKLKDMSPDELRAEVERLRPFCVSYRMDQDDYTVAHAPGLVLLGGENGDGGAFRWGPLDSYEVEVARFDDHWEAEGAVKSIQPWWEAPNA